MPTVVKNFNIPLPLLSGDVCDYFTVRFREKYPNNLPYVGSTQFNSNTFNLTLELEKIYEIQATHHCCDGSISLPRTIDYSTITAATPIYVKLEKTDVSDTCATTPGSCRDCQVIKNVKLKFFSDSTCTIPLDVTGKNLIIKTQEIINNVFSNIQSIPVSSGTELDLGNSIFYEEICGIIGTTVVNLYDIQVINGISEIVPYILVSQNPIVNGILNVTSGFNPVDIAIPNCSGTIIAAAGSTVRVRIVSTNSDSLATSTGSINGVPFFSTFIAPHTQIVIMPITGIINFNLHIDTIQLNQTSTIELF